MIPDRAGFERFCLGCWAAALLAALALVGCSVPRIFQKKVPADTAKPTAQSEGEKRAASYIAKRSAPPVADPAAAVSDIHDVATGLAASLGEPEKPVAVEDKDAVIRGLRDANLAKDRQLERWKEFGRKYGGKPLEDTGINLAGPAGIAALAGIIALCIACPGVGYLLLRVVPLLWGFFRRTTAAVAEFATENPDSGEKLAQKLSVKMDEAHKALVRKRAPRITRAATPAPAT